MSWINSPNLGCSMVTNMRTSTRQACECDCVGEGRHHEWQEGCVEGVHMGFVQWNFECGQNQIHQNYFCGKILLLGSECTWSDTEEDELFVDTIGFWSADCAWRFMAWIHGCCNLRAREFMPSNRLEWFLLLRKKNMSQAVCCCCCC